MRIKATQLLKLEDFPKDVQAYIGKLLGPVNDFFGQVINAINGAITFTDNIVGQEFLFSFTYASESVTFPANDDKNRPGFAWTLPAPPKELVVCSALEEGVPFIAAVAWKYTAAGQVQLTSVVRLTNAPAVALLQSGKKYQIRVRVTP